MKRNRKEIFSIKKLKIFLFVLALLNIMNIVILIGRNQSYAFFRRTVSSKRIIEIHVASEFPKKDLASALKNQITSHTTEGVNLTVEDEDGTIYLSGTNDQINFNYVWYSGKLWRITAINPDNTIKMVTQDAITAINWGEYKTPPTYEGSWIYQWLNEDFLDTLENQENIIVQDAKWYATADNSSTPAKPTGATIDGKVGLLNAYEYYQSYKNLGTISDSAAYGSGYLNIGYVWWLMTPYSSFVRNVGDDGILFYSSPSSDAPGVRPSVNLKSDIKISGGAGKRENPYRIEGDKIVAKVDDKLNSRVSGEYVNFDGKKYRIVGIENDTTKLTSVDYVKSGSSVMKKNFSSSNSYVKYGGTGTTSTSYWAGYLNDTTTSGWYGRISAEYKNMLVQGTYYLGTVGSNTSYKNSICSVSNTTDTTKECNRLSGRSAWTGYVGLPRVGEMFSAQLGEGSSSSSAMWLITPESSSDVRNVFNTGLLYLYSPSSTATGVRPSINLKSDILISSGEGTLEIPYEIKCDSCS